MIRRAVASLALVGALAGCTTFSDGDAIARVDDQELSEDFLDQLTPLAGPGLEVGGGTGDNADAVRNIIGLWIQVQVIDDELAAAGIEITEETRVESSLLVDQDPVAAELTDDARAFVVEAQAAFTTFNQLPDAQAAFEEAAAESDIVVASRYGTFNPDVVAVLPLGASPALFEF